MSRILIAGCGYLGSALGAELARRGHRVHGLKRRPSELPPGIWPVGGDLTDPESLAELPEVDVLFYTAAADRSDENAYRSIYVDGLKNILSAVSNAIPRRVIFTSSTAVYGQEDGSLVDELSPTEPTSFRGRVLLEAEAVVASAATKGVTLRLAGLYGPGRTRLLDAVLRQEAVFTSGRFLNLIHRDDAVGALGHLMRLENPKRLYLGVDSEPADQGEVLRWLASRTGRAIPREREDRPFPRSNKRCSNRRLIDSGYLFRFPTYREGFRSLLERSA